MSVSQLAPGQARSEPAGPEIAQFYDGFSCRLLHDYIEGNARLAAAIDRVSSCIDQSTRTVLDIGCGIGHSAAEYLRRHPHVGITAVDISERNIETARKLFGELPIRFERSDLADGRIQGQFDVLALVDVYEHIPRNDWRGFNQLLADRLSERGTLVVTTPSPMHQDYLRAHEPGGLQIVDETVTQRDVMNLCEDLGGNLAVYEFVSIWRRNDYLHFVIQRDLPYGVAARREEETRRPNWVQRKRRKLQRRYEVSRRRSHVLERLGNDATNLS